MKKQYIIFFEAPGFGGTTYLYPIKKKFDTEQQAETAIEHLITSNPDDDKFYGILPVYTRA